MKFFTSGVLMVFISAIGLTKFFAAEAHDGGASLDIKNIGFLPNPSNELAGTFPMCDAFLRVEWIDVEKRIGYANYEAKMINEKGDLEKKTKTVWALVNLDDSNPSFTLNIYSYKRDQKMNELFELVKHGQPVRVPSHFAIKYKGKVRVFYEQISPVLGDNRKTICIPYPDAKKAWIVEGKTVKNLYADSQLSSLSVRINEMGVVLDRKRLERLWIVDLNLDGNDDYLFDLLGGELGVIGYSGAGKIYRASRSVVNGSEYLLTFPTSQRTCQIRMGGVYPLITDGKNYYLSNQCNLTQLTSVIGKE